MPKEHLQTMHQKTLSKKKKENLKKEHKGEN